jgi:cadmium resistance protein CadD (predicted permease)
VFTAVGAVGTTAYVVIFVFMVAIWCAIGRFFATRPVIARTLDRWGHIILPVVLITIGTVILIQGGAFGL